MTKKVIIQNLHIITFMMIAILVGCSNNIENNKKPSADNMQTTKKATITDSQQTKEDTVVKEGNTNPEIIKRTPMQVDKAMLKELESLTPAQILNLYLESLKKGDHKTVNLILTERFLKSINNGQGYDKIQPQKISNITIKLDDIDYGEPLGEKINNDQEANYILQFNIDESTESYFYAQGVGQYYLFVKLLNENNIWKIDVISTSP